MTHASSWSSTTCTITEPEGTFTKSLPPLALPCAAPIGGAVNGRRHEMPGCPLGPIGMQTLLGGTGACLIRIA